MNSSIFHLGLSSPAKLINANFQVFHTPTIDVEYYFSNNPDDINEYMQLDPIVLILSQNGVRGIKLWLKYFNLDHNNFDKIKFWTIGERTHEHLKRELNIISSYPHNMTGEGVTKILYELKKKQVLLSLQE